MQIIPIQQFFQKVRFILYIIGLLQKYHNTLCCPSKILHKHCVQFLLGQNWKQYLCKRLQQKVTTKSIMVFFKRPILTFKSLYKNPWSNHSNETSSAVLLNTTFWFLVFYKTKFSIFLTFGQWKECTVIHNYCENNKFKENFYFVKTQNSKK